MAYDVRAVANLVLDFGERAGIEITNITINKIIFFLHAWYLVKTGRPLVSAKIEAWDYGPVFRELYFQFRRFGRRAISERARRRNPKTAEEEVCTDQFSESDLQIISPLLEKYASMSAGKLIQLSHMVGAIL